MSSILPLYLKLCPLYYPLNYVLYITSIPKIMSLEKGKASHPQANQNGQGAEHVQKKTKKRKGTEKTFGTIFPML